MIIKLEELVMILDQTVQSTSDSSISSMADYRLKRSKKKERIRRINLSRLSAGTNEILYICFSMRLSYSYMRLWHCTLCAILTILNMGRKGICMKPKRSVDDRRCGRQFDKNEQEDF